MTLEVLHVVGARPNFPKAAPVLSGLEAAGATQLLVHTGQHYDDQMSESFFRELNLPRPDINLGVGSGTHARQTANIMVGLEEVFEKARPRLVVVYGDVNSTLSAAVVASKLCIPIAHVEAGLRSFDRRMPEEVNRVLTDQVSDILFTTSPEAADNLRLEGVPASRIHFVGNTMIDSLKQVMPDLDPTAVRRRLSLPHEFVLATLHRPSNVDDPQSARSMVHILNAAAERLPVVLPLHPRGRKALMEAGLSADSRVLVLDPLSYLDFVSLLVDAQAVITDSGGVQEETTYLRVPCLTLRSTTERPITISHGSNRLVSEESVVNELDDVLSGKRDDSAPLPRMPPLWDGHAGERISDVLMAWLARSNS